METLSLLSRLLLAREQGCVRDLSLVLAFQPCLQYMLAALFYACNCARVSRSQTRFAAFEQDAGRVCAWGRSDLHAKGFSCVGWPM